MILDLMGSHDTHEQNQLLFLALSSDHASGGILPVVSLSDERMAGT